MSIHYDKLTFTIEEVEKDAKELNGTVTECDIFYSIVFNEQTNKQINIKNPTR